MANLLEKTPIGDSNIEQFLKQLKDLQVLLSQNKCENINDALVDLEKVMKALICQEHGAEFVSNFILPIFGKAAKQELQDETVNQQQEDIELDDDDEQTASTQLLSEQTDYFNALLPVLDVIRDDVNDIKQKRKELSSTSDLMLENLENKLQTAEQRVLEHFDNNNL